MFGQPHRQKSKSACISCTQSSKRKHIYGPSQSGGRIYEIKTLRSNLAPKEGGGGVYSKGAYNRASTVYMTGKYFSRIWSKKIFEQ